MPSKGRIEKELIMKFKAKGARLAVLLAPALALATPALANSAPSVLNDATEPGSVIVFPKFINAGSVALPEGGFAPVSELEIGVICPKGVVCAPRLCRIAQRRVSNLCKCRCRQGERRYKQPG